MKFNSKDKLFIICCISILFISIFTLCYYLFPYQGLRYDSEAFYPVVSEHSLIELNENTTVSQNFNSENIHLKGLKYYVIKGESEITGSLHVSIMDNDRNLILDREVPFTDIQNAEWYSDYFSLTLKKNHIYRIDISAEKCTNNNYPYLVVMGGYDQNSPNLEAYQNNELLNGNVLISYEFAKLNSTYINVVVLSLFTLSLITILFTINVSRNKKWSSVLNNLKSYNSIPIRKMLVIVLFVIQFFLIIPNIVYKVGGFNLDPSWRYFLNIANSLNLKYGTDIYFTYGPLGYICYLMNLDNSSTYWFGIGIWGIIFVIHIILLIWLYKLYLENKLSLTAIVLSVLVYVSTMYESERDNYQLYLLLLSVVIYFLGNSKSIIITNLLLSLMFFCKFSTFTSGVAFITIFIILRFFFDKDKKCILLMLPSLIIAPISYLVYNPSLKGLYEYVTGILRISSGWMKTQQWDDAITNQEYRYLLIIVLLYIMLIIISLLVDYHKSTILISCSVSLFFAYKYSVTAHGIAMGIWLVSMLFSAIVLSIDFRAMYSLIRTKKKYAFYYAASIVGCLSIASLLCINLHNNWGQIKDSLKNKVITFATLKDSSLLPELYDNTYIPSNIIETIGNDTVTTYPWEVGYKAVYTNLNMVYSPSIQNCNEFIPWLDQKVADYFYSEQAPKYIILEDETIYFHIKYLDNPLTWEAIKDRYNSIITQEGFCLLERQDNIIKSELTLIRSELYSTNDSIKCPENADYVKIHLRYSFYGEIKDFFWRTGMTYMTINYKDGSSCSGVIIVPNMTSGFSLDYVPQNLEDVSLVLNTEDYTKISSIQFSGIGLDALEKNVEVEWFQYAE
ncbi:hypothetical protein [Kineothrix sedimenti]|uniref:Dolichyl-phosphate-mannose-protein mannosyltransferase n=1 Tax=Kineothrix sedimenti TaxID=3123317 RepID=A0ABZ3ETG5_9FIRM